MAACRIDLRHDQSAALIEETTKAGSQVRIYAPSWVQEGLDILTKELDGCRFEVHAFSPGKQNSSIIQEFTIRKEECPLDLIKLQMVARCEERNVTGVINKLHYSPAGLSDPLIYALRDLVRQCIIVGLDETTHYGGYPSGQRTAQKEPVYIIDLAGLQFQQAYNTGRLVLLKDKLPVGLLDDFIFEKVVGEKRKSFQEVNSQQHNQRYTKYSCNRSGHMVDAYFDTKAYRKFVENDVLLCGKALAEMASASAHFLNFKFLKYGTGYFAGNLKEHLEPHVLPGVIDGLERFFEKEFPQPVRALEFPFFREDSKTHERLEHLKEKYGLRIRFSHDDALKNTSKKEGLITAVTNCGDPHAAFGNEMGFGSVDGAVAENLRSKGNIFCPLINHAMQSKFINISWN